MDTLKRLLNNISANKKTYITFGLWLLVLLLGMVLSIVGGHNDNKTMLEVGLIFLMFDILGGIIILAVYFFCPEGTNCVCCCENNSWESYGEL